MLLEGSDVYIPPKLCKGLGKGSEYSQSVEGYDSLSRTQGTCATAPTSIFSNNMKTRSHGDFIVQLVVRVYTRSLTYKKIITK